MAHKTMVDGTSYENTGGKTMENGTVYSIAKGRTMIGGTGYDISFRKDIQITINIGTLQDTSGVFARVTIDGTVYNTSPAVLTVPAGTEVLCSVYCSAGKNGYVYLNGTVVYEKVYIGVDGGGSYTYVADQDTTITLYTYYTPRLYIQAGRIDLNTV